MKSALPETTGILLYIVAITNPTHNISRLKDAAWSNNASLKFLLVSILMMQKKQSMASSGSEGNMIPVLPPGRVM